MLGERRAAILRLIIEYYIKTGEPIGSKTLCNLLPYAVSSATIRNEMAHLSNLGYLEQRHTSGGRVPGKNAYRWYVDHLREPKALSPYETAKIDERLSVNAGDAQRLLADAADLLADATHCAAFSCALADAGDVIQGRLLRCDAQHIHRHPAQRCKHRHGAKHSRNPGQPHF